MCFPANIAKFLRTTFHIERLRWLLLNVLEKVCLLTGFVFKILSHESRHKIPVKQLIS